MKRSRFYIFTVSSVLLMLVVAGCSTPKADSCPTTAPQFCPTTAAQVVPQMNDWRWSVSSEGNVVITFDKGDKCSIRAISPLTYTQMNYEIVVNDTTYQNYMVVFMTLDPGKTLADLEAWTIADRPPFAQFVGLDVVNPASRTAHSLPTIDEGELYFTCFAQGPDALKIIGNVGPVKVPKE